MRYVKTAQQKLYSGKPISGAYCGLKGRNTNQCRNTYFFNVSIIFNFDIISLNTAGIGGPSVASKRRKIFDYAKKHSSPNGIMFLQETHSTEKVEAYGQTNGAVGKGLYTFRMASQIVEES